MRSWGKWVSEIRIPKTKQRIWLGSYDDPEKAARAYDAARYCIYGENGEFNFPSEKRPELRVCALSKNDIKSIAFNFASSYASLSSPPSPSPMSPSEITSVINHAPSSPDAPVSSALENTGDLDCNAPPNVGNSASAQGNVRSIVTDLALEALDNIQLDDFVTLDIEWINSL